MSGTPHVDEDGPTGSGRKRRDGMPWQLVLAVVAWVVLGALLVVSALTNGSTTSDADQGSVDQIQSQLGSSAAATGSNPGHPTLWLLLGFVVLVLALLLLIGQGWARYALGVLGLISVIVLGLSIPWEAIVAFVMLVLGSVPLLAPSAHRYLSAS